MASKRTLVITSGNEAELINCLKKVSVPFFQMRLPRVKSKADTMSEYQTFVDKVSDVMCPQKNKDAEPSFVVLTGIRSYDDFSFVLDRLTNRCEYHIIYFTLAQVSPSEVADLLKQYHERNAYYVIPGVTFCRASEKYGVRQLQKAS